MHRVALRHPWPFVGQLLLQNLMCSGVVPQQPPTGTSQPCLQTLKDDGHHFLSGLIVLTELIGQSCIRMHAIEIRLALIQFIQPRAQFLGAQCAIKPTLIGLA